MPRPPELPRQNYEKAGRRAETYVSWYLRLRGYKIIDKRVKTPRGEIDIIARRGSMMIYIEVKQRATRKAAEAALPKRAQNRVTQAAQFYHTATTERRNLAMRFDLCWVIGPSHRWWAWRVHHMRDAWRMY